MDNTVVCLMFDDSVAERIPSAIRSLQIGLIDEQVTPILTVPDSPTCIDLAVGPTAVIPYRPDRWPRLSRESDAAHSILAQLRSLKLDGAPLIHCLGGSGTFRTARELADLTDGQMIVSVLSIEDAVELGARPGADQVRAMFLPSTAMAEALEGRLPKGCRSLVVPLGVTHENTAREPGAEEVRPMLVFAGPLGSASSLMILLRGLRRLIETYPWLLLFVIGKGPAESALRSAAEDLDVAASVIFTGRIEYFRNVLSEGQVFCVPNWDGGYREETVHAMSAGTAIVAARGGPHDGLVHEETAILYEEGDEDGFVSAVTRLLGDPDVGSRLGKNARAFAREHSSVSKMSIGYAAIYHELGGRDRTLSIGDFKG